MRVDVASEPDAAARGAWQVGAEAIDGDQGAQRRTLCGQLAGAQLDAVEALTAAGTAARAARLVELRLEAHAALLRRGQCDP
jgi:hypothetical protein